MFKFNKKTELIVQSIAKFSKIKGIPVYFVGGMVRDALMGIDIKDIDILTEGSAIDFVTEFYENSNAANYNPENNSLKSDINGHNIVIKSVHKSFNTAKTVIDGIDIDFASTREEEYPESGCLPVVKNTGCSISLDLKRRDYTVNAIAAQISLLNGELEYKIIDPYFGFEDIKQKTLKALHQKSYIDDPTRILRGLDFILRFGFDFSMQDKNLIEEYLKAPNREGLSIDRVKLTLKKLFLDKNRVKEAFLQILDSKYYRIWENEPSFKKDWAQRLYDAVKIFEANSAEVFLDAIFENKKILENQSTIAFGSNYEIYNFFKNLSNKDLALRYAILNDKAALHFYKNLKDVKPDFTGANLLNEGFVQGKELGNELKRRFMEKLNSYPSL